MASPLPPLTSRDRGGALSPEDGSEDLRPPSRPHTSASNAGGYGMLPVREHEFGIASGGLYQAPHAPRPMVLRPDARSYLRETLCKLSQDTVRVRRRLHTDAPRSREPSPPTSMSTRVPSASPDASATGDVDNSGDMSAEPTETPDLPPMFAAWAADDEEAPPPEPENIAHAILAVARVIGSWEKEVRLTADIWSGHLSAQAKWSAEGDDRWIGLHSRLENLEKEFTQVSQNLQRQDALLQTHQDELGQNLRSTLEKAVSDIGSDIDKVMGGTYDRITQENNGLAESIKTHVTQLVSETLDRADGQQKTIGKKLESFNGGLGDLSKSVEAWGTTVEDLRKTAEDAKANAARVAAKLEESQNEVKRLGELTETLRVQLEETSETLQKVTHAPAAEVWKTLKDIEVRGNLKIDRQSGKVATIKPIEFLVANPDVGPEAELKDTSIAFPVLFDIAAVSSLFKTPLKVDVQILPGKGGKPEFWIEVARNQARVMKMHLMQNGVEEHLILETGQLAKQGVKANFTLIQLSQDLFASAEVAAVVDGKAVAKGKASPKKK